MGKNWERIHQPMQDDVCKLRAKAEISVHIQEGYPLWLPRPTAFSTKKEKEVSSVLLGASGDWDTEK